MLYTDKTTGAYCADRPSNLDGWTGNELLTEALKRSEGDAPALRLMQDVMLRALLAAHDRELATDRLAS